MNPNISSGFTAILLILLKLDCASCFWDTSSLFSPFVRECDWLYRENPDDCGTYFQCRYGQSVLRRCPRKLQWNSEGMYCDWETRARCKAGKRKVVGANALTTYEKDAYGASRKKKPSKQYEPGKYYADPAHCDKFFVCDGTGQLISQSCPPGLHFNPLVITCDWPSKVNCKPSSGSGPAPVSVPEDTTTSATTTTTSATTTTSRPTLPPFIPDTTTTTSGTTTSVATTTTTRKPTTQAVTEKPTEKPSTIYPIIIPNTDFIVVCYFASWAVYRKNGGKFTPSHIDPSKCTHIIYAFAIFSPVTYEVQMFDSWVDGPDGLDFYGQITSMKKLGVTPILAIGGWNDSGDMKWDKLLSDPEKMLTFIRSLKAFLLKYGFMGVDIDYEYPACPNVACAANLKHQKEAFSVLIRGIREHLGKDFIITAAISCNENIVKVAYDLRTLSRYVSWFNVMTYDYHGSWEKETGILAPFQAEPNDKTPDLTVVHSIEMLMAMGVSREKICLGIPAYAATFTLADARHNGHNAPVIGPGEARDMTGTKGMMSYGEICQEKFSIVNKDPNKRRGPYCVRDTFWATYDDREMIHEKSRYIAKTGLLGAMVWSVDMDDFHGHCGEKYPCLSKINEVLRGAIGTRYTHKWRKIREQEKKKNNQTQSLPVQRKGRSRSSRNRRRRL